MLDTQANTDVSDFRQADGYGLLLEARLCAGAAEGLAAGEVAGFHDDASVFAMMFWLQMSACTPLFFVVARFMIQRTAPTGWTLSEIDQNREKVAVPVLAGPGWASIRESTHGPGGVLWM